MRLYPSVTQGVDTEIRLGDSAEGATRKVTQEWLLIGVHAVDVGMKRPARHVHRRAVAARVHCNAQVRALVRSHVPGSRRYKGTT